MGRGRDRLGTGDRETVEEVSPASVVLGPLLRWEIPVDELEAGAVAVGL